MIKHVHGIELSNRCNLACEYCPHPHIHNHRPIGDMAENVFLQAIEFIHKVQIKHGSKKLIAAMFGESILHPDFCEMLYHLHYELDCPLQVETNGVSITDEHAEAFRLTGAKVLISNHDLAASRQAASILSDHRVEYEMVAYFADPATRHTWAGQAGDWDVSYQGPCAFIPESRAVIMVDGDVTTCCLDAFAAGKLGNVWDDPEKLAPQRFSLCESCHNG
jgi:hypothetical protein